MRKVESTQVELGGAFIGDIVIDAKLRDNIPALLRGLQHIYVSPAIRAKVFARLEAEVNSRARKDTGRPGMDLWRISRSCGSRTPVTNNPWHRVGDQSSGTLWAGPGA